MSVMTNQGSRLGHAQQLILNRIGNRLFEDARIRQRQEMKLLVYYEVGALINQAQTELKRRRAHREPVFQESPAA
jgi:hypothetical protein